MGDVTSERSKCDETGAIPCGALLRECTKLKNKSLRLQFATSNRNYVMLISVYVPYTCRNASQISPTVA
jgi:hypothetical protein